MKTQINIEKKMKQCLNCKKSTCSSTKKFCSDTCRRFYLSEMMIKRSIKIKKEFGNTYYTKKDVKIKK